MVYKNECFLLIGNSTLEYLLSLLYHQLQRTTYITLSERVSPSFKLNTEKKYKTYKKRRIPLFRSIEKSSRLHLWFLHQAEKDLSVSLKSIEVEFCMNPFCSAISTFPLGLLQVGEA